MSLWMGTNQINRCGFWLSNKWLKSWVISFFNLKIYFHPRKLNKHSKNLNKFVFNVKKPFNWSKDTIKLNKIKLSLNLINFFIFKIEVPKHLNHTHLVNWNLLTQKLVFLFLKHSRQTTFSHIFPNNLLSYLLKIRNWNMKKK